MSKIGRQPVKLVEGVKIEIDGRNVKISGPKGVLSLDLPREISCEILDGNIIVKKKGNNKLATSLHGTFRSLIQNMVTGVSTGFKKQLELIGTGFRAEVSGSTLTLIVGYSHPVLINALDGIVFKVEKNIVSVEGIDKQVVGHMSSIIRAVRPPEPYKGKGIKYIDEIIRRKPGKAAAKTAGGAA